MHQLQYSVLVNCGLTAVPSVLGRIFLWDRWGWGSASVGTGVDVDQPIWGSSCHMGTDGM